MEMMKMSKAILEFSIPEESEEFRTAINANKYVSSLDEFGAYLRNKLKYEELSEAEYAIYEKIRTKFYEIRELENE